MGDTDDMAGAAIYLSSRASSWTTGVILNVDGGACTIQMPLSNL
jgi:NAD(P)-dependent dehydrogenase (short-subunit alcohol dehydrogenase family)